VKKFIALTALFVVVVSGAFAGGLSYGKGTFVTTNGLKGTFDFWFTSSPAFMSRFKVGVDFGTNPPGVYYFNGSWMLGATCKAVPLESGIEAKGLWNGQFTDGCLHAFKVLGGTILDFDVFDALGYLITEQIGWVTSGNVTIICR
jgi:hypothetical protein